MDITEHYRHVIEKIMKEYAGYKPSHGNIDTELIIDIERNHYELMHVGWDGQDGQRRVHGCVIHLDIIGDKIWIQYDGTSYPVADELLAAGISKESIVLGFHPADVRQYTGFAIG